MAERKKNKNTETVLKLYLAYTCNPLPKIMQPFPQQCHFSESYYKHGFGHLREKIVLYICNIWQTHSSSFQCAVVVTKKYYESICALKSFYIGNNNEKFVQCHYRRINSQSRFLSAPHLHTIIVCRFVK